MLLFILDAAIALVILATALLGALLPSARRGLERRYQGDRRRIRRHLILNLLTGIVWGIVTLGRLYSMSPRHR